MKYFRNFFDNWRHFFSHKNNLLLFIGGILFLTAVVLSISQFFGWNEIRPGVHLNDPILAMFKPIDLTWFTFIILYGTLLVTVIWMLPRPEIVTFAAYGYGLLVAVRMLTMYLLALEAPLNIIPLEDPFVALIGGGVTLQKDLFFSGHTGSAFFFFLLVNNKKLKYSLLAVTGIIGTCVLLQHVHYSIDVFSAPFFTFTVFVVIRSFINRFIVN